MVASWWHAEMSVKGITGGTSTWEEFKKFLHTRFLAKSSDDVVPLSGLNVQLKRVHGDTCVPVGRSQRWNLFQAQCMIKGKACKLMIDGGSCTSGISKAMVAAL